MDADYFWKFTHNAYDFSVLFLTPITFPIAWHESKVDGVTARVSSVDIHGFLQAYTTLGHTRARYFPPENGGLIPLGGFSSTGVFTHRSRPSPSSRMPYSATSDRRTRNGSTSRGATIAAWWSAGVPDVASALMLTPSQQVDIGFSCNGTFATLAAPITSCNGIGKSTLLTLPQTGTENDDHNPDRVKARSLYNIGIGTDNLWHKGEGPRMTLRFTVTNLTEQGDFVQFPVDFQRNSLRRAAHISGIYRIYVLSKSVYTRGQ